MAGPRWCKLDVDYFANPKSARAGRDGRLLHLAAICYCASQETDGHITAEIVPVLLRQAGVSKGAVARLVHVGLLVPVGDGFEVHDYLAMQDSRATIELRRKRKAERMKKWRADRDV
jgi:hypothetical protein